MNIYQMLGLKDSHVYREFLKVALAQNREFKTDGDNYLFIEGNMPLCLVAHIDTVGGNQENKEFTTTNNVVRATMNGKPSILGADDRAGCWILYEKMLGIQRPHILLTNYEERGAIGARAFVNKYPQMITNTTLFVEIDRRGADHFVYYNQPESQVLNFATRFGLNDSGFGSFSDIKVFSDKYKIPSINLATGYYSEHSNHETLNLLELNRVNEVVQKMINSFKNQSFGKIVERDYSRFLTPIHHKLVEDPDEVDWSWSEREQWAKPTDKDYTRGLFK